MMDIIYQDLSQVFASLLKPGVRKSLHAYKVIMIDNLSSSEQKLFENMPQN